MIFNISKEHIINILKLKIPLSFIWLLEHIKNKGEIPEASLKDKQYGERKGYLDAKGDLTKYGEELYESLFKDLPEVKIRKIEVKDENFEKWWDIYPASDYFEYKGRVFKGYQKKNIRKDECKKLFNVLIMGGRFTAEDIIRATEHHVEITKEKSFKENKNYVTFITNSERYLRERRFEPFINKIKEKEQFKSDVVI